MPVPASTLSKPLGMACTIWSFCDASRSVRLPASRFRLPICLPITPMTSGVEHGEQRTACVLAEARKLGHGTCERGLILTAEQRPEQCRALVKKRGLTAAADHVGEAIGSAGLLPNSIDKILRSARLRGRTADAGKQRRHGSSDGSLSIVTIKTEHSSDARDHVRCQELHHE